MTEETGYAPACFVAGLRGVSFLFQYSQQHP